MFRLPKRLHGRDPQSVAINLMLDFLRALVPIRSATGLTSWTTRGTLREDEDAGKRGSSRQLEIPEWSNDRGWSKGDFVVRSKGVVGPGPWAPNDAIANGRQTGTWVALQDIISGGDADGPSLDSTKWRIVAPHATEQFVLSKTSKGLVMLDVGRDGTQRPRVLVRDADTAQGGLAGEINLDVPLTEGRAMKPLWATFCVRQSDGTNKKMRAKVLMSEPEEIPGE